MISPVRSIGDIGEGILDKNLRYDRITYCRLQKYRS